MPEIEKKVELMELFFLLWIDSTLKAELFIDERKLMISKINKNPQTNEVKYLSFNIKLLSL